LVPGIATAEEPVSSSDSGRILVVGKVSDNPRKHAGFLKPIGEYVATRMEDLGVTGYKILMARDNAQMMSYLREGRVDWVTETAFSAAIFARETGAEPLVRKWKKGVAEYHTVFFTRHDSGLTNLSDLRGKVIAFEDPGSTSAFYIPTAMLISEGLELVKLTSPRERPPEDKVGFVFSNEEVNSSTWVHKGLVDAAAFSNLDWEKDDHTYVAMRKDLKIFEQSLDFPRAIEMVRPGLEPEIKARLRELLLSAHLDPDASNALRAYQKTARFDEITPAIAASLDEAQRIADIVRESAL